MRILIPFLCLILLVSCHNKSDLKKIAELEKENAELKEKYKTIYFNKKLLEDSILGGGALLGYPNVLFDSPKIISSSISRNLSTNIDSTFSTEIKYIVDQTNDPYLLNSISDIKYSDVYINSTDFGISSQKKSLDLKTKNFILRLKPKGSGWNYYSVKSTLKNDRTGNIIDIILTDSFYVYK